MIQNKKIDSLKKQLQSLNSDESNRNDEAEVASKIKSVSPMALLVLGVCATISELATAFPYFAFLAILFNHQLSLMQLTIILVVYNIIYTSPLIVLYLVYIKAQDKFDRLYMIIKIQLTKWSNVIAPTVIGGIGIFLVSHSITVLLK